MHSRAPVLLGDKELAKTFIGFANSIMQRLEESMQYEDLKQDYRYVEPFPGALIKCSIVFGIKSITIDIPFEVSAKIRRGLECLCTCNFTTGKIIEQTGTLDNKTGYGEIPLYAVLACHKKVTYKIYENCMASDFTPYISGQKVILVPYNGADMTCCTETPIATACSPLPSTHDISNDDWRTTYRIIPWNGFILRKWINEYV